MHAAVHTGRHRWRQHRAGIARQGPAEGVACGSSGYKHLGIIHFFSRTYVDALRLAAADTLGHGAARGEWRAGRRCGSEPRDAGLNTGTRVERPTEQATDGRACRARCCLGGCMLQRCAVPCCSEGRRGHSLADAHILAVHQPQHLQSTTKKKNETKEEEETLQRAGHVGGHVAPARPAPGSSTAALPSSTRASPPELDASPTTRSILLHPTSSFACVLI